MAPTKEKLSSSLEDYLEAVLELELSEKVARVRDIAKRLGVGMPSVSVALKALAQRGLVNYDPYQSITLTDEGKKIGGEIGNRHQVLRDFLVNVLGLEEEIAQANACRMEHAIDQDVLERLQAFARFIEQYPEVCRQWIESQKLSIDAASECPACDEPSTAQPEQE